MRCLNNYRMTTNRAAALPLLALAILLAVAPSATHAQTPAVKKAFEEVRTKLDDLVNAKDENLADDLALRIQTFKKVLEFSAEEAKSLKVKLITTELDGIDGKTLAAWKEGVVAQLDEALAYYDQHRHALTTSTPGLDIAGLKARAVEFKTWRETNFLPRSEHIQNFLLVAQQASALEIAAARLSKIRSDVAKLERARIKGTEKVSLLFAKAAPLIQDAEGAYRRAEELFFATYLRPVAEAHATSTAATSTAATSTASTSTASLFSDTSTSTDDASRTLSEAKREIPPAPSIRDEVRTSLDALKNAYRTFIEMSVEVKKILR